ncbi:DUF262 domain-containing protein [Acidithiobacillus sp.]|jgi:hypothetical protein|uniref:DUF262 domain-containing protein n=1 Tax=Acidithiobacillus sp. TaxID=1872118 RepID=UPI0025B9818E|nr:DUF262 domain-containing protein [Acidithiobacillus sp.]MCK9187832.1 DUF262 domain-containing protein [Acidithiobacillus sp.]MCK9358722.1 DUF262 domain-containing protein [Acidithiobacillus sp.]
MLQDEIENAQRLVRTDAYQLSVGEIANMYKNGEFIINPDFQRLFRWEIGQKSKLIESLLLGIPVPSVFVFEREDSTWELVDGLQRISTLLEFMGELIDPTTSALKPPIALVATKYLPSLDKVVWEKSDQVLDVSIEEQIEFSGPQKLSIKRSRLSVEILKRPSDNKTKYDLFQRLNAGGTAANAQELRNCIIIMVNEDYATFMRSLSVSLDFLAVLSASEDQIEKQRHMEYVSRFLVHTYIQYGGKLDVEEFIDESIVELATQNETQHAGATFNTTFSLLNQAFGSDALRRIQDGNPTGRVGLAAFECIAVGVAKNITHIQSQPNPVEHVKQRIREFWDSQNVDNFFSSGLRGTVRIQRTVPFGENWFSV